MSTLSDTQILSRSVLWGDGTSQSLWTQFADDAAIVSDSHSETQLVITYFQRWATWSDLPIRPDKSFAFGAAQRSGHYQQILPNFHLNVLTMANL